MNAVSTIHENLQISMFFIYQSSTATIDIKIKQQYTLLLMISVSDQDV